MIAAVVGGKQAIRMDRISSQFVEIDDGIEMAALANPLVDRKAINLIGRSWMIKIRPHVRENGRADNFDPVGMSSRDDLLIGRDHFSHLRVVISGRCFLIPHELPEIIHTFE